MGGYENLLTAAILLALVILIYCKLTKKSLGDIIRDIKSATSGGVENIPEVGG